MPKIWILVADRARARLFAGQPDRSLAEIETFLNPDGRAPTRELVSDRASRMPEMAGRPRGALEPRNAQDHVAELFARQLRDVLESGLARHSFERLVLIAPPEFLGILHSVLGEQCARRVFARIDKNLSEATAETIAGHLPRELWSEIS